MKWLVLGLIAVFLVSGCTDNIGPEINKGVVGREEISGENPVAASVCESLCNEAKSAGKDLSSGPCLSDGNPEWNIKDWVCDVAHSPRQEVDNFPENQCGDYRAGRASHFVEVSPECKLIRAI